MAVKTLAHFSGYLNRPDATAAAWAGDFLRSDDIGVLEKDGRLRIIDRKNGLIISGGENVYAAEVERVLISHPQVRDVTVIGKPDPRWGEVVVAVVVPEPGPAPDPSEVIAFCRARLAGYKCPREVQVWDDLPRNSMGKIQRFIIRDRVAAGPA